MGSQETELESYWEIPSVKDRCSSGNNQEVLYRLISGEWTVFSEKMQSETSVERTKSKSILKPEEFFEKRKQETCQIHFLHSLFFSMIALIKY